MNFQSQHTKESQALLNTTGEFNTNPNKWQKERERESTLRLLDSIMLLMHLILDR